MAGIERIEGGADAAKHSYRVKDHRVFGTIGAENGKDIAFLESTFSQARGHAPHGGFELRIGVRSAARSVDQRRLVLDLIRRVEDEIGERDFRDRDFRVWSAKNHP